MNVQSLTKQALVGLAVACAVAGVGIMPASGAGAPHSAEDAEKGRQTVGIGTANASGVDTRGVFQFVVDRGDVVNDRVVLVNYQPKPAKVSLFAADAFTTPDGAFGIGESGKAAASVGAWTKVTKKTLVLPARGSAQGSLPTQTVVPFRMVVPKNAEPGDVAGGIIMKVNDQGQQAAGSGVIVDQRVGMRMYVRVSGESRPALEVQDLRATYNQNWNPISPGATTVTYRIVNTGNVTLSATQRVRVDGLFGVTADSPALPDAELIIPGSSVDVTTVVPGTWPTIRSTDVVELDPFATTSGSQQAYPTVTASTNVWTPPWPQVLAIALLIALAWAYRRWRAWRSCRAATAATPDLETPELVDA